MKFTIEKNLLQLLLNYLMEKPYKETEGFIRALASLPVLEESKKE